MPGDEHGLESTERLPLTRSQRDTYNRRVVSAPEPARTAHRRAPARKIRGGGQATPVARWALTLALGALGVALPMPNGESDAHEPEPTRSTLAAAMPMDPPTPEPELPQIDAPSPRFPLFLRRMQGVAPDPELPPPADGALELLLTFDDGPNLETTPLVLDELDRRGIKAVFFIAGHMLVGDRPADRARRYLVRKLARHGHMIANHTINHHDLCQEKHTIDAEIDGNAEILTATTGLRPVLFRSPYGARCRALQTALQTRGLVNVGWNVDPQEWRGDDAKAIASAVIVQIQRLAQGRGTVLLHDTKSATAHALPIILDWIERQNRARSGSQPPRPIRLVDYSVFLPSVPLPPTGAEAALAHVGRELVAPFAALLGTGWASPGFGL